MSFDHVDREIGDPPLAQPGDVQIRTRSGTPLAEWAVVTSPGVEPDTWHAGTVIEVLDAASAFTAVSGGTVSIEWDDANAPEE